MVDDQPAKLLSYEVILGELGENLIKATSGREALEQLLKNDIAIVLMDVSMPELDGFELAEMIHQHPRCQKTAVIFISAVHLTDLDQLKGYEHGAVDYISVPVIPELLRAKVSVFAELHRENASTGDAESRTGAAGGGANRGVGTAGGGLAAVECRTGAQEPGTRCHCEDGSRHHLQPAGGRRPGLHQRPILRIHGRRRRNRPMDSVGSNMCIPTTSERSLAQWMHCVESGENYESEYRLRGRDGQYRWFRARAVPIRDQDGEITRWYGTCSDIHDSKLLEQSMRESAVELEKMVDERTAALRRLSSRLMTMQDDERRRIAREVARRIGPGNGRG